MIGSADASQMSKEPVTDILKCVSTSILYCELHGFECSILLLDFSS